MTNGKILIIAALVAMAHTAWAQPETSVEVTKAPPGKAAIRGTTRVTATVQEIVAATRTVLLRGRNGKIVEVVVGEARNFDQLKVGDVVTVVYREALTLSLKKESNGIPSVEEHPSMERAPAGGKPGGTLGREVTIVTDVVAVSAKHRIVTLKGPKGNLVDLKVEDPEQFANIRKGDQVKAVYTEALAISVDPAVKK
jgi:hypothetical protein